MTLIKVRRIHWRNFDKDAPRGSGYCVDQGQRQELVKEYRLFGLVIWTKILDTEEIPMYAQIELGVFGRTDWKSKFSAYI